MKKLLVIRQELEKRMTSFRDHLLNCVLLPIIAMSIAGSAISATPKPAELSENETKAFESMCKAFAESFLKGDEDGIRKVCISKDLVSEVFSPKLLQNGRNSLHKMIVEGNTKRFNEYRRKLGSLEGFKYLRAEHGYRLIKSETYSAPRLVLKNSYVVMAYANRLIVKVKIEDLVYIGGKYHLTKLD